MTQLIDSLGIQLQKIESASVENIAGHEYPTPQMSRIMGRETTNISPNLGVAANFQVKADLDMSKFSSVDPTPHDELTFE